MLQSMSRAGTKRATVGAFVLLCLATLCLIVLPIAWAQTAGQYAAKMPDLRGRWAGFLLGATDQSGGPASGAVESFRFEAEIADSPGGWQMTLTRATYDPGFSRQPISVTFPISYDADGRVIFTAQIPNRDGKPIKLDFKGNQSWPRGKMLGRGFHGYLSDGRNAYANRMSVGRITDAPGIAPAVPGLSAAELARWPVTLAQHYSEGIGCDSSDSTPPALVHVDGNIAVYSSVEMRSAAGICVLHDVPRGQPLYAATDPNFSDMSEADKAALQRVMVGSWNTAGRAVPANATVVHYVKNEHLYRVYDSPKEDAFFTTGGGKNSFLVLADDLRAAGGAPLSPGQFLAARAMQLSKANRLAAKAVADAPNNAMAEASVKSCALRTYADCKGHARVACEKARFRLPRRCLLGGCGLQSTRWRRAWSRSSGDIRGPQLGRSRQPSRLCLSHPLRPGDRRHVRQGDELADDHHQDQTNRQDAEWLWHNDHGQFVGPLHNLLRRPVPV